MVGGALFVLSWKLSLWESYLCFNPQGERIFRIPRLVFWLFWNFTGERAPSRTQCWHQGSWQLGIRVPCCSCAAFFIHIKWGRSRSHSKCGHSDEHTPPFGSTRQIWNHLFGMNHRMCSYFSLPRAWPKYIKISKHSVKWGSIHAMVLIVQATRGGAGRGGRGAGNKAKEYERDCLRILKHRFCGETKP
jgi:hypothetical protein